MLDPEHPIAELLRRDERYHFDAYVFVFEALQHAQEEMGLGTSHLSEEVPEDQPERHVTGQELCEAMRQFAHKQYGYLAKGVLNHWGIHSTGDFGEIVFSLIEIEQMRKTPNDRREDFDDVFDFEEGFQHSFEFSMPDSSEEPAPLMAIESGDSSSNPATSAASVASPPTKSRWQLIVSGTLFLLWLAILGWLAAGG